MRTLSAPLLAAQKAASGAPFVRVVAENNIRDLKHLVFSQTLSNGDPDGRHGAAGDTTFHHRVRIDAVGTGNCQYHSTGAPWITLSSAADAVHCAIAAVNNTRVAVVYTRGLGIYFRESTDQGVSFSAEALIGLSAGTLNGVAVAYKNTTGDLAVFWADNVTMKRLRRTAGAFGATTAWTQTAATINGIGACYLSDFCLIVTGTETTTLRPTVWSLVLGDGFNHAVDLWTAFFVQQQAEADELLLYSSPFVGFLEVFRMTFVEKFSGSPAYTRTYWTATTLLALYSPGHFEWMDPAPLNNAANFGYAISKGKTPEVAIYSRGGQTLEAPTAAVTLDMSANLLEATVDERDGLTQRGTFVFDNSAGQYAGPPAPILLHRTLDIGIGYGAEYSRPPTQTITGWEYRRSGGKSHFVLFTRGADYWLELSRPRTTIVQTRPLATIIRGAAARTGLDLFLAGNSTRSATFNVEWVVHPHQSQLSVLRAISEFMPDIFYTFDNGGVVLYEPLAGDSVDYTYGTDHAIYRSRWNNEPHASAAEVLAVGVLGSSYDYAELNNDRPVQIRLRSPHETVAADADANAVARIRKSVLDELRGELVTPPNCGLQIGDVVGLTDTAIDPAQVTGRVTSIKTVFKRSGPAVYEQHITLSAV